MCVGDNTKTESLAFWISKWSTDFPARADARKQDRVIAPMAQKHRASDLALFFSKFISPELAVDDNPALDAACKPWFFGYFPTLVQHGWEPEALGTIRIHMGGTVQVLLVAGAQLKVDALDVIKAPHGPRACWQDT